MTHFRKFAIAAAILVCALTGTEWIDVRAETSLERQILSAPMPHVGKGGKTVISHFARLEGFLEGNPGNAARLQELHDQVARCVADRQRNGASTNPPTEWPRHLDGIREDFYTTDRYAITYQQRWVYGGLNLDCSHQTAAIHHHVAVLKSSAGQCHIDLLAKSAKGQCDMDAHRAARPRAARTLTPVGDERKIAGIACQTRNDMLGTLCVAAGGRLASAYPMVLSRESEQGLRVSATEAALDRPVAESVFAPQH